MNTPEWIWKLKYRRELTTLDALHNDDSYLEKPSRYLQMLRECPNFTLLKNAKSNEQRWYALAFIFSRNCKHQEHQAFWAIADKHTTPDFWRTYLDVKVKKDSNLPHHQMSSVSYQDKTWWERWPCNMLASIAHSDHIYGGKSHDKRPLDMRSIPIMERELVLSVNFGNEWLSFKQSVFKAFLNMHVTPDTIAYDENQSVGIPGYKIPTRLDYDPVVHFLRNMYSTYQYEDDWIIEQCLRLLDMHKPTQTSQDFIEQRMWFNKRYQQAIATLENYPKHSDRIEFALNFLQVKQANLSANVQGHYALYGTLPNTELLEKSFLREDVQTTIAIADMIIDPKRSLETNFETAYHTYQLRTTAVKSAAIEFETPT